MIMSKEKKKAEFKLVKIGAKEHRMAKIKAVLSGKSLKEYVEDLIKADNKE